MRNVTTISENLSGTPPSGFDYHWDDLEHPISFWEYARGGGYGTSGMSGTPDRFLRNSHLEGFLIQAKAEWFLPIIKRMAAGEAFTREQLETLAAEHRESPSP